MRVHSNKCGQAWMLRDMRAGGERLYLAFFGAVAALLRLALPPSNPNVLSTPKRFLFATAGAAGAALLWPPPLPLLLLPLGAPGGGGGPAQSAGLP